MRHLITNWTEKLGAKADAYEDALDGTMDGLDDILNARYGEEGQPFGAWQRPAIVLKFGSKYCRIEHYNVDRKTGTLDKYGSVAGFLDLDGNILMAASFRKPALNGPRGSIFDPDFGMSAFNDMGTVRYK